MIAFTHRKSKKYICLELAFLLLAAGCSEETNLNSNELISLEEIRTESVNINDLDQKYENLDLSKTSVYIPDCDQINDFSIFPVSVSPEEREAFLLETAKWFGGEEPDINNIIYRSYDGEDASYQEVKDDPDRGQQYFVYYKNDDLDLGINIPGQYIYALKKETAKTAGKEEASSWFIDNQETNLGEYDLREEIPHIDISLQDAVQPLAEIVENMVSVLNEKTFFKIDGLTLCPNKAAVYRVGEKEGVNVSFRYKYKNVPIDYHSYASNIETGEFDGYHGNLACDASAVLKNGIDEFYGAHLYFTGSAKEPCDKFIGFDDFLGMVSEKLTGNSTFVVESAELLYGVKNIYPKGWDSLPKEEKFNIPPIELKAYPMWVAYLPRTNFTSNPRVLLTVDAVTGEMALYQTL